MDRDSITRTGARAPGVGQQICSNGGAQSAKLPRHRAGIYRFESGEHEGGMPTRWARQLGASLGRHRLTGQPGSRTGENPPYGILGEAMETSASFEARSAPLPYPTFMFNRLISARFSPVLLPS